MKEGQSCYKKIKEGDGKARGNKSLCVYVCVRVCVYVRVCVNELARTRNGKKC